MSDITEHRIVMGGHSPEADSELHKFPVLNDEEESPYRLLHFYIR